MKLFAGTGIVENVTFTPTDSTDFTTTTGTVVVNVSLALTASPLTAGTAGVSYSKTLTASGGTSPYSFTVTAGSLPSGLSLSKTGVLTGTPKASGTFSFTVSVSDAANPANKTSVPYKLTINAAANNSVAGYVYIDANNTGQRMTSTGQAKIGIPKVTVRLVMLNSAGAWVSVAGQSPVVTASNWFVPISWLGHGDLSGPCFAPVCVYRWQRYRWQDQRRNDGNDCNECPHREARGRPDRHRVQFWDAWYSSIADCATLLAIVVDRADADGLQNLEKETGLSAAAIDALFASSAISVSVWFRGAKEYASFALALLWTSKGLFVRYNSKRWAISAAKG